MSQIGGPSPEEIKKYAQDIEKKYSGQSWFGKVETGIDDGGLYIALHVTCRKDAVDAGLVEGDYPKVKFCYYSVGAA